MHMVGTTAQPITSGGGGGFVGNNVGRYLLVQRFVANYFHLVPNEPFTELFECMLCRHYD